MNDEQLLRYSRQIMLPDMDVSGQQALISSRVLIVGMGGLGCPAALYLAAAGVGTLVIADDDLVELSNLQRQIAHSVDDLGQSKVNSAAASLRGLNPDIALECMAERLSGTRMLETVAKVDLVLDCTDNFSTRFEINAACLRSKTPLVSAAAIRMEGQVAVFDSREAKSPCYQCLYSEGDDATASCSENGVMAPVVGIIGAMQALEAIKILTGIGESLCGRLLLMDGRYMQWRELRLAKDPKCGACS